MPLRDYQEEAIAFCAPKRRAFVHAPAGSGKTVIGAHLAARVAWKDGLNVGWLCNTQEQKQQAAEAISRVPCPYDLNVDIQCAAARPDFSRCDIIIVDEAHHLMAETWFKSAVVPSAVIYGLSATPFVGEEERDEALREVFAGRFFTIDRKRLEDAGYLTPGKVYLLNLDEPGQFNEEVEAKTDVDLEKLLQRMPWIRPRFNEKEQRNEWSSPYLKAQYEEQKSRIEWRITQELVQSNAARNAAAIALAKQESVTKSVLVLVQSIEHGEMLEQSIPGSVLIHSKVGKKRRREIMDGFRDGSIKVLIGTSLCDEGFDAPRAAVLILVAGGRSAARLEQRAGRVLRPFASKEAGIIYDFSDTGSTFGRAQANARRRVYNALGYAPETISFGKKPETAACMVG